MDFGPEPNLMPEPPAMDNQQPPMMPDENMGPDMGNNADLDGEDEMDPKKSIQKQTGKLASELRNYLGEADPSDANETATWALKMINSAGSNVLNANSKKSIIKALKDGGMEDEGGDDMGDGIVTGKQHWNNYLDRKSTRLNSSHSAKSRMPSSA